MITRTKIFFLKSVFLFVCTVLCGYGVFWVSKHVQEKRESMDTARAQEEIMTERTQQKNEIAKEYAFVRENEGLLRSVFLDENNIVPTIEQLESLAQKSEVSVEITILDTTGKKTVQKKTNSAKTDNVENKNEENKIMFLVKTNGTYEKTFAFLEALEHMQPVISFEAVNMRKNESAVSKDQQSANLEEGTKENVEQKKEVTSEFTLSFSKFSNSGT